MINDREDVILPLVMFYGAHDVHCHNEAGFRRKEGSRRMSVRPVASSGAGNALCQIVSYSSTRNSVQYGCMFGLFPDGPLFDQSGKSTERVGEVCGEHKFYSAW